MVSRKELIDLYEKILNDKWIPIKQMKLENVVRAYEYVMNACDFCKFKSNNNYCPISAEICNCDGKISGIISKIMDIDEMDEFDDFVDDMIEAIKNKINALELEINHRENSEYRCKECNEPAEINVEKLWKAWDIDTDGSFAESNGIDSEVIETYFFCAECFNKRGTWD